MTGPSRTTPKGRGAADNPTNRFERLSIEAEEPGPDRVATAYLKDTSRTIITRNTSPDIPFDASINVYRGCEHGCSYCYARNTHEYLGFSAGLDFESRILVKEDAPDLLERELSSDRWQPQLLAMSGVTDPYQPIERKLELTRACLDILARFRQPVGVITKNALVTRDLEPLQELARFDAIAVTVTITSLDADLSRRLEPRASHPRRRIEAIRTLAEAGIPAGVNVAPIIPGLTEHEVPAILKAVAEAGGTSAGYTLLRLPGAVADLFADWLDRHEPGRKEKVLNRVREMRGGRLNDPRFGDRFRGHGEFTRQVRAMFHHSRERFGLDHRPTKLSTEAFRRPGGVQMGLFGE